MEKLVITGGTPLKGEVTISGAKNAAVAILPATLLINGICTIENLPNISDVKIYCEILEQIGAKIAWIGENINDGDDRHAEDQNRHEVGNGDLPEFALQLVEPFDRVHGEPPLCDIRPSIAKHNIIVLCMVAKPP